ncbi:AAA family ATPase [Candidatus Gracilibacteria bacterium]|nr:AAA family ATPase [Candidatus Gracilibacteria bacterium]
MKIAIIGKGGAGKTTLSVCMIKLLSKEKKVIAIDADSNKNLIDYLGFQENNDIYELGDLKKDIFLASGVSSDEYERKYFPKDGKGAFSTDLQDEILKKVIYSDGNTNLIQLGAPRVARVGVTGMCPYNETIKVYLANLVENDDEIVWIDFAAGSEVAGKGIIASIDNVIIPLEPNSKNLDVAKDIYKTLKFIDYKNVYFVLNKIRNKEDVDFIKKEFLDDINIIGVIPFSKEIMKMDITGNIDFDNMSSDLQKSFLDLKNNILNLKTDKNEVLSRLQKLDILKGDKKCH